MIFSDETKINKFKFDGHAWCWVKNGESYLQTHHVSQTIKYGGGAFFCVGLYAFMWHGLHVQDRGKDDMSFVSYHSLRWGHEDNCMASFQPFSCHISTY